MSRPRRARTEHQIANAFLDVAERIATSLERIADQPDADRLAQEVVERIAPRPHPKTRTHKRKDQNR